MIYNYLYKYTINTIININNNKPGGMYIYNLSYLSNNYYFISIILYYYISIEIYILLFQEFFMFSFDFVYY